MNRIIDTHNFVPSSVRQESSKAIIIHELGVHSTGMQACALRNMSPAIIDKESIGVWDASSAGITACLATTLMDASKRAESFSLAHMAKQLREIAPEALKNAAPVDVEKLSVFENIDILEMFRRCGFRDEEFIDVMPFDGGRDIVSANKLRHACEDALIDSSVREKSRFMYALLMLTAFTRAARAHDALGDGGFNKDRKLPVKPTVDQLEDWIAKNGGCNHGPWIGGADFLGWSGNPDPFVLEAISGSKAYMSPLHLHGISSKRSNIRSNETNEEKMVNDGWDTALVSIPSAPEHRNYREMNWHLEPDEFEVSPIANRDYGMSETFDTSEINCKQGMWANDAPMFKRINDGLNPCGAIVIPVNAREEAIAMSKNCRTIPGDIDSPGTMFCEAVGNLISRLITCYGPVGSAIIYQFISGYYVAPVASTLDIEDPENDDQFKKACYNAMDLKYGPIVLEAVYNKVQINNVRKKGKIRERFIKYVNDSMLEDATLAETEFEIDRALERFSIYVDRSGVHNFLDEAAEDSAKPFTSSMDSFIDEYGDADFKYLEKRWDDQVKSSEDLGKQLLSCRKITDHQS